MLTHPWHDISVGNKAPEVIHAIIEIPKNSHVKYELDKETGMLKLDRYLYSSVHYPADYGFVPQSLWYDGDPLDIFILTGIPTHPMTLCEVRVIGVVQMIDEDERDDKILSVHTGDPRYGHYKDVSSIPPHALKELTHFLETYKDLQGKKVEVFEILGAQTAHKDILTSMQLYKEAFGDASVKSRSKR